VKAIELRLSFRKSVRTQTGNRETGGRTTSRIARSLASGFSKYQDRRNFIDVKHIILSEDVMGQSFSAKDFRMADIGLRLRSGADACSRSGITN